MPRPLFVRRILVPTDLTEGSSAVIDATIGFGLAFGASVELIYIDDAVREFFRALGDAAEGHGSPGERRRLTEGLIDGKLARQSARRQLGSKS